jgi:hypothetical protein
MKKFSIPTIIILVLAMLFLTPAVGDAGSKAAPRAPWLVSFHDGSANGYRFWKDSESADPRFEYAPIQPKDSSTGMYSGGEPASGVMRAKQVGELWKRIQKLEADAGLREKERMKGTGAFLLKDASGNREFIIASGPQLDAFNKFLSAFRRGTQGLIQPDK